MFGRGVYPEELREQYNFGPVSISEQGPPKSHDSQTHHTQVKEPNDLPETPTNIEEAGIFSENDGSIPPNRRDEDTSVTSRYHDAHVSSFNPERSVSSTPEAPWQTSPPSSLAGSRAAVGTLQSVTSGDADNLGMPTGKADVSAAGAVRDTGGRSTPTTSVPTVDVEDRALLVERWKDAMAEEERLNILQHHVECRLRAAECGNLPANFPPKFLCIRPIVNHSIDMVPEPRRKYVKLNFVNWIVTCILLVINASVAITVTFFPCESDAEGAGSPSKTQATILSIVYLLGVPLSFFIWHWPVYRACITGLSTRHLVGLCGLLLALAFSVFMLIGLPGTGACGAILAMEVYETKSNYLLIPLGVVIALWSCETTYFFYCIVKQWGFYRLDMMAQREARSHMVNVAGV